MCYQSAREKVLKYLIGCFGSFIYNEVPIRLHRVFDARSGVDVFGKLYSTMEIYSLSVSSLPDFIPSRGSFLLDFHSFLVSLS